MTIVANGRTMDLPDGATLTDLLTLLGLSDRPVVVERNGDAVHRSSHPHVRLADGDRLQVVRAVAGG